MKYLIPMLLMLTACVTTPPGPPNIPITNFHQVNAWIYRGAQPDQKGFDSLKSLGIKTIVKLNSENLADEEQAIVGTNIKLESIPLSGFFAPSDTDMKHIQGLLEDPANYPIFVHCLHGEDRTGLVIGIFRLNHDKWTKPQAKAEMNQFGFHDILLGLHDYFEDYKGEK